MRTITRLALAALFLLYACGDDSSSSPDPSGNDTDIADTSIDTTPMLDAGADAPEDSAITVSGRVLSPLGATLSDVQVGLLPDRVTATDDDGRFEFTDVEPPYDIITITRPGRPVAVLHQGLTRSDPSLWHRQAPDPRFATVDVTVTGGLIDDASPPSFRTRVGFVSTTEESPKHYLDTGTNADATGEAGLTVQWAGGDSITGRIVALQWELNSDELPATYTGFGFSPTITISDGDMLGDISVALDQPVSDTTIDVDLSGLPSFDDPRPQLYASFQNNGSLKLGNGETTPFTFVAPSADQLTALAYTTARKEGARGNQILRVDTNLSSDGTVEIAFDEFRSMLNPPGNASDIDVGQQFTWEAAPDDLTVLQIKPVNVGSFVNATLFVITKDTQFTLPDLSSFAFQLAEDTEYYWKTFNASPYDSTDDASRPAFHEALTYATFRILSAALFGSTTEIQIHSFRTLTTAP